MQYAFFRGCNAPQRAMDYELSTRKVAETLGINLVDLEDFSCCGYPISLIHKDTSLAMAAVNLAVAEKNGLDIITICGACTGALTKVSKIAKNDPEMIKKINDLLIPTGLQYNGKQSVKHFVRFLYEDIGAENIKKRIKNPLKGLKVAPYYGCHYLKPSDIFGRFDNPERPVTLEVLIEAMGAIVIDYPEKVHCCGGDLLAIDEHTSMEMTKSILNAVRAMDADLMVLICPFCKIMCEEMQVKIFKNVENYSEVPTMFFTQLLGLALGLDPLKDLGFSKNRPKTRQLVEKIISNQV
jgi:heterodisulfide reductase subunit B